MTGSRRDDQGMRGTRRRSSSARPASTMPRLAARSGGGLRRAGHNHSLGRRLRLKGTEQPSARRAYRGRYCCPSFQRKFAGPTPLEILAHDAAQARVLAVEIAIFVTCLASLADAEIRGGGVLYALFPCDKPDPLFAHTSSFMPGSGAPPASGLASRSNTPWPQSRGYRLAGAGSDASFAQ